MTRSGFRSFAPFIALLFFAAACGVPADDTARDLDPSAVPFDLLDPNPPTPTTTTTTTPDIPVEVGVTEKSVYFYNPEKAKLESVSREVPTENDSVLATDVLDVLYAGVNEDEGLITRISSQVLGDDLIDLAATEPCQPLKSGICRYVLIMQPDFLDDVRGESRTTRVAQLVFTLIDLDSAVEQVGFRIPDPDNPDQPNRENYFGTTIQFPVPTGSGDEPGFVDKDNFTGLDPDFVPPTTTAAPTTAAPTTTAPAPSPSVASPTPADG